MDGKSSFNICTCFTNSSSSSSLSNWLNEILISEEGNLILYFCKYISQTIFQPQKEKETRSITVTISLLLLIDIIFFYTWSQGEGTNAALTEDVYLLKDTTNKKKEKNNNNCFIFLFLPPSFSEEKKEKTKQISKTLQYWMNQLEWKKTNKQIN